MISVILADTYYSNPGYGTSEINSDIDKAYEFWTQVVVDQNPRIPFHEKGDLRNLANAAYSNCKTLCPFGTTNRKLYVSGVIFATGPISIRRMLTYWQYSKLPRTLLLMSQIHQILSLTKLTILFPANRKYKFPGGSTPAWDWQSTVY